MARPKTPRPLRPSLPHQTPRLPPIYYPGCQRHPTVVIPPRALAGDAFPREVLRGAQTPEFEAGQPGKLLAFSLSHNRNGRENQGHGVNTKSTCQEQRSVPSRGPERTLSRNIRPRHVKRPNPAPVALPPLFPPVVAPHFKNGTRVAVVDLTCVPSSNRPGKDSLKDGCES